MFPQPGILAFSAKGCVQDVKPGADPPSASRRACDVLTNGTARLRAGPGAGWREWGRKIRFGRVGKPAISLATARRAGMPARAVKVNDRFPLPDHYFCAMIRTCRRKRCSPAKPDAPQRRQCVPDDVPRCGKDVARRPPFAQSRRTISGGSFFDQGQSSFRKTIFRTCDHDSDTASICWTGAVLCLCLAWPTCHA